MDTGMVQMNIRVDALEKRTAESVLERMGSSLTEYIRQAVSKAARGARDYEEAREVLVGDGSKAASETARAFTREADRIQEGFAVLAMAHDLDYGLFPVPSDEEERALRDAAYREREWERGVSLDR